MRLTYTLREDEYLEGIALHQKTGLRNIMIVIYAFLTLFFVLSFTDFSDTYTVIRNLIILFFSISFYIVFTNIISRYQNKKDYNELSALHDSVTLRISAKGIKINEQSQLLSWDKFSKYKENDKFFILYLNMRNFKIVPKNIISLSDKKLLDTYLKKYLSGS